MACYPSFSAKIKGNDEVLFRNFKKYSKIFPSLSEIKIDDISDNSIILCGSTKWNLWFNVEIYMTFSKLFNLDMEIYADNNELFYKEYLHINNGCIYNFDRKIFDEESLYQEPSAIVKKRLQTNELVKKGQKLLLEDIRILGEKGKDSGGSIDILYYFMCLLTSTRKFLNCSSPNTIVDESFIDKTIDLDKFKKGIELILEGERDWDNYLLDNMESNNVNVESSKEEFNKNEMFSIDISDDDDFLF